MPSVSIGLRPHGLLTQSPFGLEEWLLNTYIYISIWYWKWLTFYTPPPSSPPSSSSTPSSATPSSFSSSTPSTPPVFAPASTFESSYFASSTFSTANKTYSWKIKRESMDDTLSLLFLLFFLLFFGLILVSKASPIGWGEIQWSRVRVMLWLPAGFVLGSSWLNSSSTPFHNSVLANGWGSSYYRKRNTKLMFGALALGQSE